MPDNYLENFHASALKNQPGTAPRIVAQGTGVLAKRIEAVARQHKIPVLQDFALSQQLSAIPLGDEIPETLYFTVANLFAYILELEEQHADP